MRTRILIAEDSPAVRAALRSLLERAGPWDVIDVKNGQEAVAKAQELKPDLIIIDLVMPVMDGLTAARHISKLLPEIPMLMHTMHWSSQIEVEAQKVGVRKVVSKANSQLLLSTIRQFLTAESPPPLTTTAPAISSSISPLEATSLPPTLEAESTADNSDNPTAPRDEDIS
jgi:CheY-like chemotaxis protein